MGLCVWLSTVVGEQRVTVGRFRRCAEPANAEGTDSVEGRIVRRDHRPGPLERLPKAYRPVAHGQPPRRDSRGQIRRGANAAGPNAPSAAANTSPRRASITATT